MAALDLLLINPGSHWRLSTSRRPSTAAVEPPFGQAIAEYVREILLREVLDAEAEHLGPEEVAQRVEELS